MYLFNIEVKASPIEGKGVFALEKISRGQVVWQYDPENDKILSVKEFEKMEDSAKSELKRIAYLSPSTNRYVYPSENDQARFTNHSVNNNLSVVFNKTVSDEPYFITNRDINIGEEITNNYLEFDDAIKDDQSKWL